MYHRDLSGQKSTALVDGGAVHVGIAHGLATRNWDEALLVAHDSFDLGIEQTKLPPEDIAERENHWQLTQAIIQLYGERYENEEYEIIQPECSFDVPLPRSGHNCIWTHWVDGETGEEHLADPIPPEKILAKQVRSPHWPIDDPNCPCWGPHHVAGQTDCIVRWHGPLWLMDHKTSSLSGDPFWNQWDLDMQGTIYIYGVWKSLGILPKGFIINHLFRPSEKQVAAWNASRKDGREIPQYMRLKYERRPFLRTTEDLARLEATLVQLCDEWEWRITTGNFRPVLQRGLCDRYNSRCEFFGPCVGHEEPGTFAGLYPREMRYDDQLIQKQLIQIKEKTNYANK